MSDKEIDSALSLGVPVWKIDNVRPEEGTFMRVGIHTDFRTLWRRQGRRLRCWRIRRGDSAIVHRDFVDINDILHSAGFHNDLFFVWIRKVNSEVVSHS